MTSPREAFLQRVRQAVADGNRAGATPSLPDRGAVGYQGAGSDPVARFRDELTAAGGRFHLADSVQAAVALVVSLVEARAARRVLLGDGSFLDTLPLEAALTAVGVRVDRVAALEAADERVTFFGVDVGVSGADHLIAETGTVVLATRRDQPRSLSLLPPVHIVVAHAGQLVADLFDLFDPPHRPAEMPACLSLITGPSKTGDIELRLVTGVHGPGEIHVVLVRTGADDARPITPVSRP